MAITFTTRDCRFKSALTHSVSILAITSVFAGRVIGGANERSKAEAERSVAAAVQAEIGGDTSGSFKLLHDAVRLDPENRLAHSQLGEINVDGKWMAAEEAQRRAAADPLQAEYRQRKTAATMNARDQLALARWCRKSNLSTEERVHWSNVLILEPRNEEALRALDLRWQKGSLVSRMRNTEQRDQQKEARRAAEQWGSKLVKWRRDISGRDLTARDAALAEIRAIRKADAIPPVEDVTLGRDASDPRHVDECLAIGLAFVDALERMQGQPATEALARHAVFAPGEKVRLSAIEKLKARDWHDFVPLLVDALGMPIETTYSLSTGPDGSVHYFRSLYREGADSDWSWDSRRSAVQRDLGGERAEHDLYTGNVTVTPKGSSVVVAAKKATVATAYENRYAGDAVATETRVRQANESVESLNARIVPVLAGTTGKDFGDNPKAWWDWWRGFNEYASDDHPIDQHYDYGVDEYRYNFPSYHPYSTAPPPPLPARPPVPRRPGRHSCFIKGTQVWTKVGLRPIESIERGDLVLSQNLETGDLKYSPVICRTVRPPSPIVKLTIDKEEIRATRGHLFWVAGTGWRMSKELERGAKVHGLRGSSGIDSAESNGEAEAYNLVVADVGTYFVGDHGFLVHDNTPRGPTQVILPGVLAKK